jgi:nitroimidazol reductase NimA-like FMN-containing flavoprotein (pyridoxamine 5'-phosphate oxidase superfamily)
MEIAVAREKSMSKKQNEKDQALQTERTTLVRRPERGRYDFPTIAAILDEACLGHIGFASNGQPFVLPTAYGRDGNLLYFHGHAENHMFKTIGAGAPICFTTTIVDGFVLAKSAFRHSMNYRSVVVLGKAELVTDFAEKQRALEVITNHVIPGRWNDVRVPKPEEVDAVVVVKLKIEEASAKIRMGNPADLEEDRARDSWCGVIPVSVNYHPPLTAPDSGATAQPPEYTKNYKRPKSS